VSDVNILGERDYSIRGWLDPEKLAARNMTTGDVVAAVRQENKQVVSGQLSQPPTTAGVQFQPTLSALGRLVEPSQFAISSSRPEKRGPKRPSRRWCGSATWPGWNWAPSSTTSRA